MGTSVISFSDDYNLESSTNGRNWTIKNANSFNDVIKIGNRLVAGSKENYGLLYSDDYGLSWINSNITTGNWGNLVYMNKIIYACSMDGKGIDQSSDIGENYEVDISQGTYSTKYITGDGTVSYVGGDGVIKLPSTLINPMNNARLIDNGFVSFDSKEIYELFESYGMSSKILSMAEIDGLILILINKITYPYICYQILGTSSMIDDTSFITLKSGETKKIVFASQDVYKISRYTSIIDWENDIGMKPFTTISIADLLGEDTVEDEPLNDINANRTNYNKKLTSLIKKISSYITYKRNIAYQYYVNKIEEIKVDTTDIVDNSSSTDMIESNLEVLSTLLSSQKDSALLLIQQLLTEIFTFNESSVKSLINSAIYETVKASAGLMKINLIDINHMMVNNKKYTIDNNRLLFTYDFYKGLENAFDRYIESVSKNILMINENSDKDIIKVAATYYKNTERSDLIDNITTELRTISFRNTEIVNGVQDNINTFMTEIKNYLLNNLTVSSTVKKTYISNLYSTYIFDYAEKSNTNKIILEFFNTYNINFKNYLNNELKFSYFSDDESELSKLANDAEKERCYGYLNEIHQKFIDRCEELLMFVFENYANYTTTVEYIHGRISSLIDEHINTIISKVSSDMDKLNTNDNINNEFINFNYRIYDYYYNEANFFITNLRNYFENNEGVI